jgi:hypothetical protein
MAEKKAGAHCRGPRLGLLADSFEYEFQTRVLVAAERAAREHSLDFVAVSGGVLGIDLRDPKRFVYDLIGVDSSMRCLSVRTPSAIIRRWPSSANSSKASRRCRAFVLASRCPACPTMLMDNEAGMHAVVKHLVETHHLRRIAFVAGPEASQEAQARYHGYERALLPGGKLVLDKRYVVGGNFTRETGTARGGDVVRRARSSSGRDRRDRLRR